MIQIGPYALNSSVLLAPMAGVTDTPFRELCLQFGAGLATSEMVTAQTRLWASRKSERRLQFSGTGLRSVQIAGSEPEQLAEAARKVVELGAQIVDINMGCPAKKVCKKAAGSSLLKDEGLVKEILHAVVDAVDVPVTLKTRTGWSPEKRNACVIAEVAQQAGIKMLALHGRTRACGYGDTVEYETIAEVVKTVDIPVVANGDIDSAEKAIEVLSSTGAQGVMLGRAAFGQPWIFQQINQRLQGSLSSGNESAVDVSSVMTAHIQQMHKFYGPDQGLRIARKHIGWYLDRLRIEPVQRKGIMRIGDPELQIQALQEVLRTSGINPIQQQMVA